MSVQTVVLIILGLLVLAILFVVVRQQVTSGAKKYTELGSQAEIKEGQCANVIIGRWCAEDCAKDGGKQVPGVWNDCTKASATAKCCESA